MHLISEDKVALSYPYIRFKKSFIANIVNLIIFILISIGLFQLFSKKYLPFYIFIISEILLILFIVIGFVMLIKTISSANWLLKADYQKLFIKIRSCLNSHLPDGKIIVEMELYEIKWVRQTCIGYEKYLDIYIDMIPEEIQNVIINEQMEPDPNIRTKCHDYPVSITNKNILRIDFAQVTPSISRALKFFGEKGILVENINYEIKEGFPLLSKK
ncbi:MAG: hypothetical protein BWY69_00292 [Planctomycetes bacterium ADurb.Bin401]|nr:MAG: hypothetical protein BWY69_00292 [Planctomycetes bacterium ADurb.Bin401]